MAIETIGVSKIMDTPINENDNNIKMINGYKCIETGTQGIFKVIGNRSGYIVRLDYGRTLKLDKKTNKFRLKQDKTIKHVETEREAKNLKRQADEIREKRRKGESVSKQEIIKKEKVTMEDVINDFKESTRYKELGDSYKDHYDNYLNHILDYFKDFEPSKITSIDIENYYEYQRTRGNLTSSRKKDGTVNKKMISRSNEEGISINTLRKHKTAMKCLWEYMIDSQRYDVNNNVVIIAKIPKETIIIAGKETKVSCIKYYPRSLTLDELNYTLNDAIQNEYDRSIVVMIALGSIGGLRRSEVSALRVGKFDHGSLMKVSDDAFEYAGLDKQFYELHDELMLIDEARMRIRNKNVIKLPKGEKIRATAVPNCLKAIVEYAMEQRKEILSIYKKEITSDEQLYLPLVNIIDNRELNSDKMSKKWQEYQERRNKRMIQANLEPIPIVRFHDLRHTHSNILKITVPAWEISCNMGHLIPDSNTTKKVYWNDRQPYREHIIKFFDNNIKIDWDKAIKKSVNRDKSLLHINGSGHFVISNENKEKLKKLKKKLILTEDEIVEMLFREENG